MTWRLFRIYKLSNKFMHCIYRYYERQKEQQGVNFIQDKQLLL